MTWTDTIPAERHSSAHRDRALNFLLQNMGIETRRRMMAELPITYAALYPDVSHELIVASVREYLKEGE